MDYSILLNAHVFRGLTLEEVISAISVTPYRLRKFNPGTMISQSGDPVTSFMMVIRGMVKGEMIDYSGRIIKIEDVPAPGAIAAAFIFGNRNQFPVNVIAVSETELLLIDKPEFIKFLKCNDKILANFLDLISNRSQFLSEKIKFLNFKTIRGKLAQYILQSAGTDKYEITLGMTQNEIAEYFGVARPSIARVLGELENEGVIITKGKTLKILDTKRLTELTIE
jgi:CRP/FNR family transcriptional regulator, dissimilatory nitrate respiration regulator